MRAVLAIVVLSSILALAPPAAASGSEFSLSGPAALRTGVTTTIPLGVALTLAGVACATDADVPVRLAVARATGVDASLSMTTLVFRIPATAGLARPWSGAGEVALRVAPLAAAGAVEVLASYQLPAQCAAASGESGAEARHMLRVELAPPGEAPVLSSTRELPVPRDTGNDTGTPLAVQLAVGATFVGALVVAAKRIRASRA